MRGAANCEKTTKRQQAVMQKEPSTVPTSARFPFRLPLPASPFCLSVEAEARVFRRMRRRVLATLLRQMFVHSRFRMTLVVVLTSLLWGGMFWMFGDGFSFLQSSIACPETYALAVGGMFSTFFFALSLMLMFSAAVILYGSLFRSREIAFLLTTPAHGPGVPASVSRGDRAEQLGVRASGKPRASGLRDRGRGTVVLLSGAGSLCRGVRLHSRGDRSDPLHACWCATSPTASSACWSAPEWCWWPARRGWRGGCWPARATTCSPPAGSAKSSIGCRSPTCACLPSWWLSTGLLDAAGRVWADSLLFLTLMISNALLFRQLALWTAERMYREAYSGLSNKLRRRKRPRSMPFDRFLAAPDAFVSGDGSIDDDQGRAALSPRPAAMVADPDFRRLLDRLFSLHSVLHLRHFRRSDG